ncbi:MAG: 50S ribosomal protein L21 [Candidatus Aminicenantes bacterium]|nr:50S ribosomal protein L21 [Candidatus Aminicenantes bacterium]
MFAIIKTGGKQYRVQEGDVLDVEKLPAEANQKFHFSQVLLIEDEKDTLIGTPFVEKALVRAEVLEIFKDEKILVFKKKRRKQYRRTRGHRQQLTRVKIERIIPDAAALSPEEMAAVKTKPAEVAEPGKEKAAAAPPPPKKVEVPAKKKAARPAKPGAAAARPKPEKRKPAAKTEKSKTAGGSKGKKSG